MADVFRSVDLNNPGNDNMAVQIASKMAQAVQHGANLKKSIAESLAYSLYENIKAGRGPDACIRVAEDFIEAFAVVYTSPSFPGNQN